MTVLVVGSSHINSLILARELGHTLFNDDIHFVDASIEAWRISPLVIAEDNFQFSQDPLAVLCRHENVSHTHTDDKGQVWVTSKGSEIPIRIPNNIRQLKKVPAWEASAKSAIVFIGVFPNPASDSYFDYYDFRCDLANPERQLLSEEVFLSIEYPVTGNYTSQILFNSVTEYLGPPRLGNRLEGKTLMQVVSEYYPDTRKYLVGFHPALAPIEGVDVEQMVDLIRRRNNFNSLWDFICRSYGWRFVTPPDQAMDEYRLFIRREFSIDPANGDPHLNKKYGELLWEKIFKIDSDQ